MTKRELVIRVANKLGMTQSDVSKIIEGTFDTISHSLASGQRWELRDFGVFEVKTRASRIGRNPRTGDQVPVPERRVVTFKPGKRMKELVAGGESEYDDESLGSMADHAEYADPARQEDPTAPTLPPRESF